MARGSIRKRAGIYYCIYRVNGKQKWVRRPPTIDGMPVDEFIARNADFVWLRQNELWELIPLDPGPDWLPEAQEYSEQ